MGNILLFGGLKILTLLRSGESSIPLIEIAFRLYGMERSTLNNLLRPISSSGIQPVHVVRIRIRSDKTHEFSSIQHDLAARIQSGQDNVAIADGMRK